MASTSGNNIFAINICSYPYNSMRNILQNMAYVASMPFIHSILMEYQIALLHSLILTNLLSHTFYLN